MFGRAAHLGSLFDWGLNRQCYGRLGVLQTTTAAMVNLDFVGGSYAVSGQVTNNITTLSGWSFTRASTKTALNSAGQVVLFASGVPAITDLGFLPEGSRTNNIRNNTMQGVVVGSPGTLPTNWAASFAGLTQTVVGSGILNGVNYVDVRYNGTTSGTFGQVAFEQTGFITASNGQVRTPSVYAALVGGSLTNVTFAAMAEAQWSSAPAFLATISGPSILPSIISTPQRFSAPITLTSASTASVQPLISFSWSSGVAVDLTIRLGVPQEELGSFPTSVIFTTSTAATRAAEVASIGGLSGLSAAAGALYFEIGPVGASGTGLRYAGSSSADIGPASSTQAVWFNGSAAINANFGAGSYAANTKTAVAWDGTGRALVANNGTVVTDAGVSGFNSTLFIGQNATGNQIDGYIRRIMLLPSRPSNVSLQALTQ